MNLWSRMGISVAFAAAFCVLISEAFQNKRYYETYQWHLCGALFFSGVSLHIVSRIRRARSQSVEKISLSRERPDDTTFHSRQGFWVSNLGYFGTMLIVFAGIVVCIVPTHQAEQAEKVVARTSPKPIQQPPPPPPPVTPPPQAPPPAPVIPPTANYKLQGIVYRPPNSTALINGRTYQIGDHIAEATLVEITQDAAVLEIAGSRMTLPAPN